MLTLVWKLLVCQVLLALHRARVHGLALMPPVLRKLRCAYRIEALAARLTAMGRKITRFEASLVAGAFREPVDSDRTIRDMLRGLKDDIRDIRCEMSALPGASCTGLGGRRLDAAIARLQLVAQETYLAADRLLWEIEEHDRQYLA